MGAAKLHDPARAGGKLDARGVADAYGRWAPVYDLVFGPVFDRGRRAAVRAADLIGGRVLEVGVGTGLSLPLYAPTTRLVGIDVSEPMLAKARERVRERGLANVDDIVAMDAERLAFQDGSFDVVVAQYVVTAVPNPEAALDEFARVLRPGGEIVLTTRIGAEAGFRRAAERALSPVANRLGWRTEFPWGRYEAWLGTTRGVALTERRPLPPLGHFSLVRITRTA